MTAVDEIKIGGMGASRRRVEDNRFIRGKGNYVDDIVLPGMLHMEILRSPLAHARIRSIEQFTAIRCSQVLKLARDSNRDNCLYAFRKVSWTTSSASCALPVMRKATR